MRKFTSSICSAQTVVAFVMVAAALALMPSCGEKTAPEHTGTNDSQQTSTQLADSKARAVDPEGPIRNIVSLAPSVTEWSFALGGGEYIVGRTDFCRWPAEALSIPSVGGLTTPTMEYIVGLAPDVVIASGLTPKPVITQLKKIGLEVATLQFSNMAAITGSIDQLAEIYGLDAGNSPSGRKWMDIMSEKAELDTTGDGLAPGVVVLFGTEALFGAGRDTFVAEMVEFCGGRNLPSLIQSSSWPQIPEETLLSWNPDLIIVHVDENIASEAAIKRFMAKWEKRPMWDTLKAMKNGHIRAVTDSRLSVPGPRILDTLDQMRAWISEASSDSTIPGESP